MNETKQSQPRKHSVATVPSALAVSRIFPMGMMIAAVIFAFVWRAPDFRLQVIDQLGAHELAELEPALEDPDVTVATRVCSQLIADDKLSAAGAEVLYRRPEVAVDCLADRKLASLEEAKAERRLEARRRQRRRQNLAMSRSDDPTLRREVALLDSWQLVATRLARRWLDDARRGDGDVCAKARNARLAMAHADADSDYAFMSCALTSTTDEARTCCMDELGGEERFDALLAAPDRPTIPSVERDFSALISASFEPDDPREQVQDWVVELGCRLHFDEPTQREVVAGFQEVIEAPGCAPTEVPWPGFYETSNWTRLCTELYDDRRSVQMSPREALCDSLEDASVDQSIAWGQRGVMAAVIEAQLYARTYNFEFEPYVDPRMSYLVPVYPGRWY